MSPELIHALACYREWLHALRQATATEAESLRAEEALPVEDRVEYAEHRTRIKAEFEN